MIHEETPSLEDLRHYGVLGMRWGVRKENQTSESQARRKKIKTAAVILGSAAASLAVIAGTHYVQTQFNVETSSIPKNDPSVARGKAFAQAIAKEPVSIVHAARGRHAGFTFPGRGGLDDPLTEYARAFGDDDGSQPDFVRSYGDRNEKVAARFKDPENRLDKSGRPIRHDVMLPEELAVGVKTEEDVIRVAWPLIKDTYATLYNVPDKSQSEEFR